MPWQPDFLSPPGLEIKPEVGRSEPRLWVRRLVVWSEPGKILRQVVLHPGLNIIWSPDRPNKMRKPKAAMLWATAVARLCSVASFATASESLGSVLTSNVLGSLTPFQRAWSVPR